MKQTCSHL